jgi:hypothetical protein
MFYLQMLSPIQSISQTVDENLSGNLCYKSQQTLNQPTIKQHKQLRITSMLLIVPSMCLQIVQIAFKITWK